MEALEYTQVLRAHVSAFVAALRSTPLDTVVPSCPDWTLQQLAAHLSGHYQWVSDSLDRGPADGIAPHREMDELGSAVEVADRVEDLAFALADKLDAAGPERACWTWTSDHVSGFWIRRSTHETVVHSWDGCNAVGTAAPIEAVVAADGIDEYLSIVPLGFWSREPTGDDDRIQFVATDDPARWSVHLDDAGMHVRRGEDLRPRDHDGDVVVTAAASDLLLFLMGRVPIAAVDVDGDAAVVSRWIEQVHF